MKIDEAVSILRAHNEWRRAPAHQPEDAVPAMGDPRKIGIAIDTVCDVLSLSDDWSRALRLADDAAESIIHGEAMRSDGGTWTLTQAQIDADPYLEDALAHLQWRGLADVDRESDGVRLTFRG